MLPDLYQILGVAHDATPEQLKERYRFLCHAFHPDKFTNTAHQQKAESDFKTITEAYEFLSDPDVRCRYDEAFRAQAQAEAQSHGVAPLPQAVPPIWQWLSNWWWVVVLMGITLFFAFSDSHNGPDPATANRPPDPPVLPRPDDTGLKDWLIGQQFVTKKGLVFDDRWSILAGEIADFKVMGVTENRSDGTYTATIAFSLASPTAKVKVNEAVIRYRETSDGKRLQFVAFVPVSITPQY